MEKKDRARFALLMETLKVTFPSNLTKEEVALRMEVYWEEFKPFKIQTFELAVKKFMKPGLFFPKPSELHKIIEEGVGDHPKEIEWMAPTKEGKALALKTINELRERWDKEDRETKKKRDQLFEQRRKELKKQSKLFERRDARGGKEITYREPTGDRG